jgi:uncharacterized cupin superfamily protein
MPYRVMHASDIEATSGGRKRPVRTALGVTAFGINQITLPAGTAGSLHDEAQTGQEELYLVLEGSGTMRVDGDEVELRPGVYVLVPAGTERQLHAGDAGLGYLAIGAPPGRGYQPRS